jgi:ethanolamine-phosphate cytidylyltransferase
VAGSFDLLHNGHIEILKKAKEMGDFLYVGVWSDDVVQHYRGSNYPILSLHERVLMTLACRYVDDVVIGVPYQISEDLIKSLNIKVVA